MRKGISLVALIITIIVLIVLTAAVILTGMQTPENAQLAVFYNNIGSVQEAVTLKMMNNMSHYATEEVDINRYKWVGVIQGYDEIQAQTQAPDFQNSEKEINGIKVIQVSEDMARNLSIDRTSLQDYYVSEKAVVYHNGVTIKGITYYNRTETTDTPLTPIIPPIVVTEPTNGTYNAEKGVNSPKLDDGMTAVYWDGVEEIAQYVDGALNPNFVYNEWYDYTGSTQEFATDYTESKWANAKTDDGSYWVWIPRYAYSIGEGYNTNTSSPIEIEFLQNTSSTSSVNVRNFVTTSGINNWLVHPGFSYNDGNKKELAGIWVAKYEMSNNGDNVPKSVPGVESWKRIPIETCFINSYNMNEDLNSHLMRNSEWGAVAYLAQSKYGRNGVEVGMNLSSGYYTGGVSGATAHTNVGQSTTGNCYGVFDMNGGAWEYVAAGLGTIVSSTFQSENAKYYEVYEDRYEDRYGDAVYETSSGTTGSTSWHGDNSYFVTSFDPFFLRGGYWDNGSGAGLFLFGSLDGGAYVNGSFRSVLWGAL